MLNKLILQGRLKADPEIKKTNDGKSVCAFTVVWSEKFKDKASVCFKDCVAWGYVAEFVHKYFSKGSEILVCGKEITQIWEDKEGKKHYKQKMSVEEANFCGPKQTANNYTQQETPGFQVVEDDADLPF